MAETVLAVPYEEKDEAKALGARWRPTLKAWVVPEGADPSPLARWLPDAPRRALPGKGLWPDLVPETSWWSNARSALSAADWGRVKAAVSARAGGRCEICGGRGDRWPVECHEVWSYDDALGVQRLERCEALCPRCHEVRHFGLARVKGRHREALAWLAGVNGWSEAEALASVDASFRVWERRSASPWELDLSWLASEFGIVAGPAEEPGSGEDWA